MRTFIAIPLTNEIRTEISNLISPLKNILPFRWVEPQNYHLTLKFLDDITNKELITLDENLRTKITSKSFQIIFSKFGAFPSLKNVSVLWLGLYNSQELNFLFSEVEAVVKNNLPFKIKNENFKPHITLARNKKESISVDYSLFPDIPQKPVIVKEIILYKSELKPTGPIYTVVKKYPLE